MKRGHGEEKFETCVYTHTHLYIYIYIYIHQKLDGEPYRTTLISVLQPRLDALLRSAIKGYIHTAIDSSSSVCVCVCVCVCECECECECECVSVCLCVTEHVNMLF